MAKKPKPTGRAALPKRFRPLFDQAQTETAIRYGSQEQALGSILDQVTRDYGRQATSQRDAGQSVLGALTHAPQELNKVYSDAGLTQGLLAQIGHSPTGQRLAGELASGQAAIQQQRLGAQAGQQYMQQRLYDQYTDDAGRVQSQRAGIAKEKGLYTSSLLDQLISGDRSARHDANMAAKKEAAAAAQAQADRDTAQQNALIGQGLVPDAKGNLQPLPGGKADPNAPALKAREKAARKAKKRTTGAGSASPDAQRTAGQSFTKAVGLAKGMVNGKPMTPEIRSGVTGILANGRPATSGKVVYDDVPNGPGKTKRVPRLGEGGVQVTSPSRPAVPAFDQPIAEAATEQAMFGYVTTATVRKLQKLGYAVNQIPGLVTENAHRRSTPRTPTPPSVTRPGTRQRRDQPG
jgi:hypothetical protein